MTRLALIVATAFGLAFHADGDEHWASFRNAGTSVTESESPPLYWSPEDGIAWRTTLPGYGQSSPVVWGDTAFVTSSDGPWQERLLVHAVDVATGDTRWTSEVEATTKVENYFRNSRAAPTCVVDGQRVISFFASGDVTAMDHKGNRLWSTPLFVKYGEVDNERGTASSPAQNDQYVFVVVDHGGPSYIVALDKTNGNVVWKADRGRRVPSWSSPAVVTSGGQELVVVSSADTVTAYDAATGESVWELEGLAGNHIPSLTIADGAIFTGSTKMHHQMSADEENVAGSNCRIDLDGNRYNVRWGAERANSYYSSPLVFAGYVYYVNKAGVLYCVDAESGQQVFAKRIGNPCWASAIGVTTSSGEQYVYFVTKNGFAIVIRPGDEYEQLTRNQLWDREEMMAAAESARKAREVNTVPADEAKPKTGPEAVFTGMSESSLHQMFSYGDPTVYATVLVGDRMLIRTGQHLYCVVNSPTVQADRESLRREYAK